MSTAPDATAPPLADRLLEIEGTGDFQVEAGIPDSLAARLAVDMPLTLSRRDCYHPHSRLALRQ